MLHSIDYERKKMEDWENELISEILIASTESNPPENFAYYKIIELMHLLRSNPNETLSKIITNTLLLIIELFLLDPNGGRIPSENYYDQYEIKQLFLPEINSIIV